MKAARYIPTPALQPFVKMFMIMETEHGMENRLLPDTSVVIAFRLKGNTLLKANGLEHNFPTSVISGLRKTPRFVAYTQDSATLLVIFHDAGAAAFFKQPLHELFEQSVPLSYLVQQQPLRDTEEKLQAAATNRHRIAITEQFLLAQLKPRTGDLLVAGAIQNIKATHGAAKIKDIITGLHISRDPFEKRFRKITGTSPKQFAAIVRLRHLVSSYPQARNLTDMAYNAGYFDQAHFIKDFRSFTGQAPHDFFASGSWW